MGDEFETEAELQSLDLPTLVEKSRKSWDSVKADIPPEVLRRIEPNFNVLTDEAYIARQMETVGSGPGGSATH